MNVMQCGEVECGDLGTTRIIGRRGAQPSLDVTKGLPCLSQSKQGIVGRGARELSIPQAQVD